MECTLCHHDHNENDGTCHNCSSAKKVIKGRKSTTAKLATLIEMGWKHGPDEHVEEVPNVVEVAVGYSKEQVNRKIVVAVMAGAIGALLIVNAVKHYL